TSNALHHRLPRTRQPHRAVDDTNHRVGLRKMAPRLTAPGSGVLRHQAEVVAGLQQLFDNLARPLAAAAARQRDETPQGADVERVARRTDNAGLLFGQGQRPHAEDLSDRLRGGEEAAIAPGPESNPAHDALGGVDVDAVEDLDEDLPVGAPRADENGALN